MNPRKPSHLKAIAGTERAGRTVDPDQAVELPLVQGVPNPPDWLPNAHAKKEWKRLAPILSANKLLTEGGLSALGILCSMHGKLVQLYAAGESPNAAMLSAYRAAVNDFGLTPISQGKVKAPALAPDLEASASNAFARNGAKHRFT